MAKEKEIKSTVGFSLFFDKNMANAFRDMSNMAYRETERNPRAFENFQGRKRLEDIIALMEVFAEPFHQMGWCEDPNCEYGKNDKAPNDGEGY